MKTRKTAKITLITSALLIVGLIAVLALRDPSMRSNISIVDGQRPLENHVYPYRSSYNFLQSRMYSLNMTFDEAVNKTDAELPSSWKRDITYRCAAFCGPNQPELILIERGRVVMDVKELPVSLGLAKALGKATTPVLMDKEPDPRGWVCVLTTRPISAFDGYNYMLRKKLSGTPRAATPYCLVQIIPKTGDQNQPVDTRKGSMHLDSTATVQTFSELSR